MRILGYLLVCAVVLNGCGLQDTIQKEGTGTQEQKEELNISRDVSDTNEEGTDHVHKLQIQWYGEEPDCMQGSYRIVSCVECGWIDEEACGSVPALEHIPVAEEIKHGNCREETIVAYICTRCREEVGYERYIESEEHSWVKKQAEIWDEEKFAFVSSVIECCERCNKVK